MSNNRKLYEEFTSLNIIGVTLEHNGFQGGDAGYGGFVRFIIKDLSSTYMEVNGITCEKVELLFRGDSERINFLMALKMAVKELEDNI